MNILFLKRFNAKNKVSTLNGNKVVGGAPATLQCGAGSGILNCYYGNNK
jgi:hypothetical protein